LSLAYLPEKYCGNCLRGHHSTAIKTEIQKQETVNDRQETNFKKPLWGDYVVHAGGGGRHKGTRVAANPGSKRKRYDESDGWDDNDDANNRT